MAIACHVVRVGFVTVDSAGARLDKTTATTKQMLTANTEHRVFEDSAIASSSGSPSVKTYVEREAAAGYVMGYMDQNMVVTYLAADINAS